MDVTHSVYATYTATCGSTPEEFKVAEWTTSCTVEEMTDPDTINIYYKVWLAMVTYDFSENWTQDPDCGYDVVETFTFDNIGDFDPKIR